MAQHPRKYKRWQDYASARVPELTATGMSSADAMGVAGAEWRERDTASETKTKGVPVSKSGLMIKYIQAASGELSEAQAADIAIGLLDGLLEYADADYNQEYRVMKRRAAELFRGDEPTDQDTAERRLGMDLAEFLVLAVIDRGIPWEQLEPAVLSGGGGGESGDISDPVFETPSASSDLSAEQELGLLPAPETSRRSRVGSTAVKATVSALEEIINS